MAAAMNMMQMHDNARASMHLHVPTRFASESSHSSAGRSTSENALWPTPVKHAKMIEKNEQAHAPTDRNASNPSEIPWNNNPPIEAADEVRPPAIFVAPLTNPVISDAMSVLPPKRIASCLYKNLVVHRR